MKSITQILLTLVTVLYPMTLMADTPLLRGQVFFIGDHNQAEPAVGVTVSIMGGGNEVTTLSQGQFRLQLPTVKKNGNPIPLYLPGEKVTLVVDKAGWVIQDPLDGEIRIPANLKKDAVQIRLLPIGSKKLWSHARIEKFIQDTAKKAKEQVGRQGRPQDIDFSRYIKEWGVKYGFSAQEAKKQIEQWIAETEKNDDLFKLGLAAYARKNFRKAQVLLRESAESKIDELVSSKEKTKEIRKEVILRLRRTGDASYSHYDFEEAVADYERALNYVFRNEQPRLWAAVLLELGNAHAEVGVRMGGEKSYGHLAEAIKAYQLALEESPREKFPQQWAAIQNNLGNTQIEFSIRVGGEKGRQFQLEAIASFEAALEEYPRETFPQKWAATKNNLGNALIELSMHHPGELGGKFLANAIAAFEAALEAYPPERFPQQWASTQNNLGNALNARGLRLNGPDGHQSLVEAITVYEAALQEYPREQFPQEWATTQNNLGNTIRELSVRNGKAKGLLGLTKAIASFRQALGVRNRTDLPYAWAMTQNNLGIALSAKGIRLGGDVGRDYIEQAVVAFRQALEEYSSEQLPQDWAMTQHNLGVTLCELGFRTKGGQGQNLFREAIEAFRKALTVRKRGSSNRQWAQTHTHLAKAALAIGDWEQAAISYHNVLADSPDDAETYYILNFLYHDKLFAYKQSYELSSLWLNHHPDDLSAETNAVEALFTVGRFTETEEKLAKLLKHPELDYQAQLALRLVEIATLTALQKMPEVASRLESLRRFLENQPESFQLKWDFAGTKNFIAHDTRFHSSKSQLLHLIEGIEGKEKPTMLAAVQFIKDHFVLVKSEEKHH